MIRHIKRFIGEPYPTLFIVLDKQTEKCTIVATNGLQACVMGWPGVSPGVSGVYGCSIENFDKLLPLWGFDPGLKMTVENGSLLFPDLNFSVDLVTDASHMIFDTDLFLSMILQEPAKNDTVCATDVKNWSKINGFIKATKTKKIKIGTGAQLVVSDEEGIWKIITQGG